MTALYAVLAFLAFLAALTAGLVKAGLRGVSLRWDKPKDAPVSPWPPDRARG